MTAYLHTAHSDHEVVVQFNAHNNYYYNNNNNKNNSNNNDNNNNNNNNNNNARISRAPFHEKHAQ